MAGLIVSLDIPSKSLVAATPTVVGFLTAPANQRVKIKGYMFTFDGTNNAAQPVTIQIGRPIDGTFTPGGTPIIVTPGFTENVQTVMGLAASGEPTMSADIVFKTFNVHPQLGYEYMEPLGEEDQIAGGTTLCFSANAPAGVNIRGYIKFEE